MKLAATVLALLLIIGGVFVWKRNRSAYAMRQALRFNAPIEQVFDPYAKWHSCDFEPGSQSAITTQFPRETLHVARTSSNSFQLTISSQMTFYARSASQAELPKLISDRISASNEVWLGTCHFAAIPRTMHIQMLFTPDARLTQATPVYVDDLKPNSPRLEAFHDSR